jgi:hypothetical protein
MSKDVSGFVRDDVSVAAVDTFRAFCIKGYRAFGLGTEFFRRRSADIALDKLSRLHSLAKQDEGSKE